MAKKGATPEEGRDDRGKSAAIEQAVSQIEKQHGKGAIMRLGTAGLKTDVPVISTGSLSLDLALGVGGLPKGRVIEIFGPESSGKPPLHSMRLPMRRERAASRCSSMPSTPLTPAMPRTLASISTTFWYRNPIPASRRLKSLIRSSAAAPSTSSSSTASPRWCRRPKSKGTWATATWAPGPAHVAGAPETHRHPIEIQHHPHFYQPTPHENRRHVRQSRNDHRRQCP